MMHIFTAKRNDDVCCSQKLIGLKRQESLVKAFCEFVWSNKWLKQSKVLHFMPTILLYGPPGTGKTTILSNFAVELDAGFSKYYRESLDLLVNKDLGETSKAIESLFKELKEQASCGKQVFLQIDDVDSLLSSRYLANESSGVRRGVNTFLTQLDELLLEGFQYPPIIAATTNMFDHLDSAVKRRFSLKIEINPALSLKEIEELISPMIAMIEIDFDIDYTRIEKVVSKKSLTPNDLILVMQRIFLQGLLGTGLDENDLFDELEKAESSSSTFEQQRKSFSSLNKEE